MILPLTLGLVILIFFCVFSFYSSLIYEVTSLIWDFFFFHNAGIYTINYPFRIVFVSHPNSCLLSRWCHSTISSSVIPFSSCPQSFPASGSFKMSQLFAWGGLSIGVSASTSVLPMNTQDWSPLGWTCWISLQSKGLSGVFSNTTVQKHQFFCTQLNSQTLTSIHDHWKNHSLD